MGPNIVGIWQEKAADDLFKYGKWGNLRQPTSTASKDTTIPASNDTSRRFMRTKSQNIHTFEDERKRTIEIIRKASEEIYPRLENAVWATGEHDSQVFIRSSDRACPVDLDYPRYDAIRRYLERNKFALAIHTMDFDMPAHVFINYIDHFGGISLTDEEWKTFLLVANTRDEVF